MVEKAKIRGSKGIAVISRLRDGSYWVALSGTVGGYKFDEDEYNEALQTARELCGYEIKG